ncbi:hypothetical protein GQ44DRAFT_779394 [Phaeosphaeriaceae sp. PMI808]|nr:hypothetical protein GQ44DRAFT_779394 [Phaeosphaeriaceae sp. PMI808]
MPKSGRLLSQQPQRTPPKQTLVALRLQPTVHFHSVSLQYVAIMDVCSSSDPSSMYSRPRSITTWIDQIFAAGNQSEHVPAQLAPRLLSTASAHTQTVTTYTTLQTRRSAMDGLQWNVGRAERVTRSSSRRHEAVTAEVAALQITEDNLQGETTTTETVHDGENEMYNLESSNRIAQLPPSSHLELVALPSSSTEPHWISAESRSISSRPQSTPFDTSSIFTKTTQRSSSPTKSSRSRSKSPVKSMVDLSLLNRQVKRRILDANQFPDEIQDLWYEVEDIQRGKHMVPIEVKNEFIKLRPRTEDCWWSKTPNQHLSTTKLLQELDTMIEIRDKTLDFNGTPALEASWNSDVHSVMLRQVTKHLPGIVQENVTAVRLDTRLVPKVHDIDAESKLVDFALVADETLIPPKLIKQVLADTKNGITSISHTTYERVRLRPICVSIETKTPDGKESTALVQLSLWATTHLNRLLGGRYSLFFAVDGEDEIKIIGGESDFGNTATLEGCYQVLAGLKGVGEWILGTARVTSYEDLQKARVERATKEAKRVATATPAVEAAITGKKKKKKRGQKLLG